MLGAVQDCQQRSSVRVVRSACLHGDPARSVCARAQGKRYSLANSRIMIHQPLGGAQGQAAGALAV